METQTEALKDLKDCCTSIETLIALDERAVEDLKNDTHNIGQEEVLTIIREFIRLKNDYKYIQKRYIPRYLVQAISNDLQQLLQKGEQ